MDTPQQSLWLSLKSHRNRDSIFEGKIRQTANVEGRRATEKPPKESKRWHQQQTADNEQAGDSFFWVPAMESMREREKHIVIFIVYFLSHKMPCVCWKHTYPGIFERPDVLFAISLLYSLYKCCSRHTRLLFWAPRHSFAGPAVSCLHRTPAVAIGRRKLSSLPSLVGRSVCSAAAAAASSWYHQHTKPKPVVVNTVSFLV